MKYDSVLFDLDGTLWDATQAISYSWAKALEGEPDIPAPPTTGELEQVMGMTAEDLTAALFPHLSLERRMELFDKCCQVECEYLTAHGGRLYPGILEVLETLSQKVPLCIVSNCNIEYIPSFLAGHRLHAYFKDWECIGRTGLPKGENIRLVMERNHLQRPSMWATPPWTRRPPGWRASPSSTRPTASGRWRVRRSCAAPWSFWTWCEFGRTP